MSQYCGIATTVPQLFLWSFPLIATCGFKTKTVIVMKSISNVMDSMVNNTLVHIVLGKLQMGNISNSSSMDSNLLTTGLS